jgi:tight adherence protein C
MQFAASPYLLSDAERWSMVAASATLGLAVAGLAWCAGCLLLRPRPRPEEVSRFEVERCERLRARSLLFRWLGPLIDKLAHREEALCPARLAKLQRSLLLAGMPLPWVAGELLAVKRIEGLLVGLLVAACGMLAFGIAGGLILGPAAAWGYPRLTLGSIAARGRRRIKAITRRLPYAVDLIALLMEAGSGFQESLAVVVREGKGTPLGEEFGEILRQIALGRIRRDALEALRNRLADDGVSELCLAVIKGEELGTPLTQILRNQAKQMLTRHSIRIEREAAEAQVLIVFPGMIVMLACLLIVLAPFVLSALYGA